MKISLTQHIIKRAKKRFKFNKNALLRTVEKAIKNGKIEKESITENIYLNGKKTKHKFIKRWENKNDKN